MDIETEIVTRYNLGESFRAISRELDIKLWTIIDIYKSSNKKKRPIKHGPIGKRKVQNIIISLHDEAGYNFKEIGRSLGISYNLAWHHYHKGKGLLVYIPGTGLRIKKGA